MTDHCELAVQAARFGDDLEEYARAYAKGFDHHRLAAWAASKGYAAELSEGSLGYWLANHGVLWRREGRVTFVMQRDGFLHKAHVDVWFVRQCGMLGGWRLQQELRRLRRACSWKVKSA